MNSYNPKTHSLKNLYEIEKVQDLWSGYGSIKRCGVKGQDGISVIVKHVKWPTRMSHPRGWQGDLSHERKVESYKVEINWYREWAQKCIPSCRVPLCLDIQEKDDELWIILEDLNASGFSQRRHSVSWEELCHCLTWLASFHATFMLQNPTGLWPVGTYWHLQTRPDELEALTDEPLKHAALKIDQLLNNTSFQTVVHGDAKLANFCFADDGQSVAAVDFQYIGGGCGMKDVAYLVGSCLNEDDCERLEQKILQVYFNQLKLFLDQAAVDIDFDDLEREWRALYPVAWTDFHRFMKGWSPGHWKINSYSERIAREVLHSL